MTDLQIHIPVPNSVTIDDAKARMEKLLPAIEPEVPGGISNLNVSWNGYVATFSFTAKGYQISGTLTVGHNWIVFDGFLPFMVSLFQGQIKDTITKHATELLNA